MAEEEAVALRLLESRLMCDPLDIPGKSQFWKFLTSGMTDHKTILISTHQVRDIDKVSDYVLMTIAGCY